MLKAPSAASSALRCAEPAVTVDERVNDTNFSRSPRAIPAEQFACMIIPNPIVKLLQIRRTRTITRIALAASAIPHMSRTLFVSR